MAVAFSVATKAVSESSCEELIITSTFESAPRSKLDGIVFRLDDPPLNDGRSVWISTDSNHRYRIAWYDIIARWTLTDIEEN